MNAPLSIPRQPAVPYPFCFCMVRQAVILVLGGVLFAAGVCPAIMR